jgi:hypothetical protein
MYVWLKQRHTSVWNELPNEHAVAASGLGDLTVTGSGVLSGGDLA